MKRGKGGSCKGYLTLFLTMCLTVLISLCMVLLKGVRNNTVRTESRIAADVAMQSILAEYHRELYNRYDVFYVDTSYGTGKPTTDAVCDHLKGYLEKNLSGDGLILDFLYRDLSDMKAGNVKIEKISLATDEGGRGFRKQATDYMYDKMGAFLVEEIAGWSETVDQYTVSPEELGRMRKETADNMEALSEDRGEEINPEEHWSQELFRNVVKQRNLSVYDLCMMIFTGNYKLISGNRTDISQYVSHRVKNQGTGTGGTLRDQETIADMILFNEYIMEKTGNYMAPSEESPLQYQTEYVIAGGPSDIGNLGAVLAEILLIRQASNVTCLMMDEQKMELIRSLSELVAALLEAPGTETLFEAAIILEWSFWESVFDIRSLCAGERVPLLKTSEEWFLDEDILADPGLFDGLSAPGYETGLTYEEYLRILLLQGTLTGRTYRMMDIVEMEIRETAGNARFRIDGCADIMEFEISVSTGKGHNYCIERQCGYY